MFGLFVFATDKGISTKCWTIFFFQQNMVEIRDISTNNEKENKESVGQNFDNDESTSMLNTGNRLENKCDSVQM